jgi:hypothetical protein
VSTARKPAAIPFGAVLRLEAHRQQRDVEQALGGQVAEPRYEDHFGSSLAMCGSGTRLAVGAEGRIQQARVSTAIAPTTARGFGAL